MTYKLKHVLLSGWTFHRRLLLFSVAVLFTLVVAPSARLEVNSAQTKNAVGESHFTTFDGARIHYVNYGKGSEALVLIHGWTMNLDSWRDQVSDFAKRNRVIVIELPGHGQSDKPQVTYSMDLFARAVDAVMRGFGAIGAFCLKSLVARVIDPEQQVGEHLRDGSDVAGRTAINLHGQSTHVPARIPLRSSAAFLPTEPRAEKPHPCRRR